VGYTNSDWCGDKVDRRSTSSFVFLLSGAPISLSSSKQDVVALSTCEAEYVAAYNASCQGLWLLSLLAELKCDSFEKIELQIDSKLAIDLAKNPVSHGRSKHIKTKFHFLRDQVCRRRIGLHHCSTEVQVADILTKGLKTERFLMLRKMLNIVCF